MLNRTRPKINPCERPDTISSLWLCTVPSLFSVCVFDNSCALALKLKVKGRKYLILQLTDHGKHSQMLSINL